MTSTVPVWARVLGWLGLAGHLAVLLWYAATGLVAPVWAVVALLVIWAVLLGAGILLLRMRPALVPLVPIAAMAVWFAAIAAGDAFLGWTA